MAKSDSNIKIGSRFKEIREDNKLTQKEMARHLDISEPTYARYERGVAEPTYTTIVTTCNNFNVNANWFIHGNGPKRVEDAMKSLDNDIHIDDVFMNAIKEELKKIGEEEKIQLPEEKQVSLMCILYEYFTEKKSGIDSKVVKRYIKIFA